MDLKKNLAAFLVQDFECTGAGTRKPIESAKSQHHPCTMEDVKASSAGSALRGNICEMEAVIVEDLVKPLIFLFKYFLPFHDTIKYDPVARCCVLMKGCVLRKLACILWQLLIIYRLGIKAIPSLNEELSPETTSKAAGLAGLAKAAYFIFITFSCVNFYLFWLKTGTVCKIFNQVILLSEKLHLDHRSPPRTKAVKIVVHASWIFVTLYVIATVILYTIQILSLVSTKSDSEADLRYSNASQKKSTGYELDFTEIHSSDDFIIFQIFSAVASFMNIFSWMLTFFHYGAWAMVFRQLIGIFYWRLRTMEEAGQFLKISHEVRTFNKIGSIIDIYNQIYGIASLLGAVVCVAYISPSIKHAFSNLSDVFQISSGLHLLLSYIPMIAACVMIAEIHRMAGSFAGIIKDEFGRFTKECGDPAECLCGIAIVHYDLSTSNVGFKGLGFFTVSYQFITTIVSVIISYSILVVQMFPHDDSDIEV